MVDAPVPDGHPLLAKSRSQSVSTVYTDSESDRPNSALQDDPLPPQLTIAARDSGTSQPRPLLPEDPKVDSLVTKVTAARDNMRREAEDMLVTAEEVGERREFVSVSFWLHVWFGHFCWCRCWRCCLLLEFSVSVFQSHSVHSWTSCDKLHLLLVLASS